MILKALKYLFGTATSDDIGEIERKLTSAQEIEAQNLKYMTSNVANVKVNRQKIQELIDNTNLIGEELSSLSDIVNVNMELNYIAMYSENTYKTVSTVLDSIKTHVNDLVMASKGIVTISLISIDELNSILHDARVQYGVTPILTSAQTTLYYQVMKVLFAPQAVILQIPVASKHKFHYFKFIPFPTFYRERMIILDNDGKNNLLISHDDRYFAEENEQKLHECTDLKEILVCPSNILIIHSTLSENISCLKKILLPRSFYHTGGKCQPSLRHTDEETATLVMGGRIFISQRENTITQVTCNGTTVTTMNRTYSVSGDCDISSSDFTIYGTRSHDVLLQRTKITPALRLFDPAKYHHRNFTILQQVGDVTPIDRVIDHRVVRVTTPVAVLILLF